MLDLGGLTVFVVDDDSDALEIIKLTLEGCGARVGTSPSARDALEQLQHSKYDAIVSDISMPEMDGYDFLRELRGRGDRTPAVAVTAYYRPEYQSLAFRAGFDMQLSKPLDLQELLLGIARLAKHEAPEAGVPPAGVQP